MMNTLARQIAQLELGERRRAVNWLIASFETFPLLDQRGNVIRERVEDDPPTIIFASKHGPSGDGEDE